MGQSDIGKQRIRDILVLMLNCIAMAAMAVSTCRESLHPAITLRIRRHPVAYGSYYCHRGKPAAKTPASKLEVSCGTGLFSYIPSCIEEYNAIAAEP